MTKETALISTVNPHIINTALGQFSVNTNMHKAVQLHTAGHAVMLTQLDFARCNENQSLTYGFKTV